MIYDSDSRRLTFFLKKQLILQNDFMQVLEVTSQFVPLNSLHAGIVSYELIRAVQAEYLHWKFVWVKMSVTSIIIPIQCTTGNDITQ